MGANVIAGCALTVDSRKEEGQGRRVVGFINGGSSPVI
jgi:hypothetical protein